VSDRGIIFSAPMVRALLAGTKTQTRRLVKPPPGGRPDPALRSPYGRPGDHLWVREAFRIEEESGAIVYRADDDRPARWRSPIHMPRHASRIRLAITAIGIERLQAISDADARAEGFPVTDPRDAYRATWRRLHGPDAWAANPWVWVIGFDVVAVTRR
jgi:hypothetical protein